MDWNAIKVHQLTDSKLQHAVLNQAGDYVLLQLTQLSRAPLLLADAIPWLRAKADQRRTGRKPAQHRTAAKFTLTTPASLIERV